MCPDHDDMELERLQDQADREGVQLAEDEEIKANMNIDDRQYAKMAAEEKAYWAERRTKEEQAEHDAKVAAELAEIDAGIAAAVKEFEGQLVTLAAADEGPECYVRVNVSQNSKGYTSERTVSLKWKNRVRLTVTEDDAGDEHETIDRFVVAQPVTEEGQLTGLADADPFGMLANLLRLSRRLVKDEIASCETAAKDATDE